jgi:3-methyladenine DNA glycosylase/8-oxoguanine DNA glycosylase
MKKPIKLKLQKTIKIRPTKPFDFDSTFHKPDHFTSGDNLWQPGIRWQTWNWRKVPLGLKFVNRGTVSRPLIEVKIYARHKLTKDSIDSLIEEVKYLYNLELDLKDFYRKFKDDKILGPIIKKWRGMRPGHPSSLYEYLIIGIVLQNASIKRSVQMFRALLENYGKLLKFDNKKLWCFWSPGALQKIKERDLRKLKIGYRAKSIKKIDEQFAKGLIDEMKLRRENRETQMNELLKLYGVGPATVWYLLFDVFHHWDFFNHISPWEQKIYSKLFFNQSPKNPVPVKKLLKYFERFGEYKQLAVHYIWEDLFWKRKHEHIPWLEKEIRL